MSSEIQDQYELSPLQQGILFHSLYDGDSDSYVNQRSFLIDGPLDADALVAAWEAATRAHSVLRTSFHWEGAADPVQRVHREMPPAVTRHDWSGAPDAVDRFDALLGEDRAAGFDPASPPLQRLHVIRFGDDSHGLVWTHHLLLLDGWSTPVLMGDVLGRYLAATAGLPEPEAAPPFGDYIAWLRRQDLNAARAFWAEALSGWSGATRLGPLRPADPGAEVGPVAEHAVELPSGAEARLRAAAAAHRVTLNTLLHAAWALVLQRYSGEAEVTFGVTSSNRPPELPRVEQMVGLFTNTLPVRVAVPDAGELGPWLQRMQAEYAAVRRYEFSPLSQVKSWIGAPGGQPLFESLVIFDNYSLAMGTTPIPGLPTLVPLDVFEKTSQPLVLLVTPQPTFSLRLRWHRDRFAAGAAERMLEDFRAALVGMAGAGRVEEVAAGLVRGGGARGGVDARSGAGAGGGLTSQGPVTVFPDAGCTLPELFERRVAVAPDAVAVVGGEGGRVRYRELAGRARGVAAALVAAGVGRGDVVGVCAERSVEMVAALVGVGLAGAAYLPLEPTLPGERLAFMVGEAGARVVLAQRGCAEVVWGGGGGRVLILEDVAEVSELVGVSAARSDDTAYVIYTSGSTGRPKGAAISHRAIVNRLLWMQDTFALTSEDRVLQKTPFGFDVSVWEVFWPLIAGATMVLARPGGHQDAEYLTQVIERQAVTTAHFVPSMLQLFLDEPKAAECGLRRVVCSGEALSYPLAERFGEALPHTELHNLYGPTEAAVDVTWWDCARPVAEAGIVPIGEPIANTRAYVLDRRLAEAPDGVPGELYLAGVQLARGYVGRPGLTAAAFVAHPLAGDGGRLYRTGDRVRRLPDGALDFLGRVDRQVKIHGYRVEPGEVEQALAAHPAVKEAAVVVREAPGGPRLAAYVTAVATGKSGLDVAALRDHLRTRLPRYMLPATITVLPVMPLSHNGKLLRAALPDPSSAAVAEHSAVPTTVREQAVADVFRDVLGLAEVDAAVGFFDLGGTSFDAVRAIRRIEGASVALLGAHPSVRELAAALDGPPPEEDRRLVRLTGARPAAGNLVCVPYGGGSAITYRRLADALPEGLALLALAVPGHELGADDEPRPIQDVARDAAEAVAKVVDGPVAVYGHCAGVALAVELARCLEESGRPVQRLFLGGAYPFGQPGWFGRAVRATVGALVRAGLWRISAASVGTTGGGRRADRAEMRYLRRIGGFDGVVEDEELAFVMRAFRHDVAEGGRYFSEHWLSGRTEPLATPITFLSGSADPMTPRPERRYRLWERFGAGVEAVSVEGGGHYFHQEQPDAVAEIIVAALTGDAEENGGVGEATAG